MALPRGFGSVRMRVTLVAVALFALALGLASFALVRIVHANLTDEITSTNRQQLDAIAKQIEAGVPPEEVQLPGGLAGGPSLAVRGAGANQVGLPTAGALPPGRRVQAQRQIETATGTITLVAQRSLAEVDSTVENVTHTLLFGVPLLVLLFGLATWWLAGRALRPVEAIRVEAAAITGSTIHRRVPEPDSHDEIGRLARTMNSMLDRLEESSQRQRRFVSDASHELRSPIAAIQTQLEVALRRGDQTDWPTVARRVLGEDQRLEVAVAELLELARLEEAAGRRNANLTAGDLVGTSAAGDRSGGAELDGDPADGDAPDEDLPVVDLEDVVLAETARVRQVPVDTTQVSAGRVRGNAIELGRLARNLLDNAGRHARSRVTVTLDGQDEWVRLVVDDDGPGIPDEDRLRVFDRFTRLDEGRARDAGGMGLGLSMVQAIVDGHHGTVVVDEAPMGGARFVVQLPRCPA